VKLTVLSGSLAGGNRVFPTAGNRVADLDYRSLYPPFSHHLDVQKVRKSSKKKSSYHVNDFHLSFYQRVIRRNRQSLASFALFLNLIENLMLLGLSLYTSVDNYGE
jgi:hypothetical protein